MKRRAVRLQTGAFRTEYKILTFEADRVLIKK